MPDLASACVATAHDWPAVTNHLYSVLDMATTLREATDARLLVESCSACSVLGNAPAELVRDAKVEAARHVPAFARLLEKGRGLRLAFGDSLAALVQEAQVETGE